MAQYTPYQALAMVREMLPSRTGNLRWNATYNLNYGGDEFDIVCDDKVAPYIVFLEKKHYPNLFSVDIPKALQNFIGSSVQQQNIQGLNSINEIADDAGNNKQRAKLLNRIIGAEDRQTGTLIIE